MPAAPNRVLSAAGRLALGMFIVWQLFYLVASNAFSIFDSFSPKSPQPVALRSVVHTWADLTGQHQNWSLFAPTVGEDVLFPAVELRWRDGRPPVQIHSDNEPEDRRSFFRVGRFRLRRWETMLHLDLPAPDAVKPGNLDGWNLDIEDTVRQQWRRSHAYLLRRREQVQSDPPDEVVLLLRRHRIPPSDRTPWDWDGPDTYPVARLLTEANAKPDRLPVERYNPVVERFEWMRRGD